MIVDDSLTVRTVFSRLIERSEKMVLVATARSAEHAIDLLADNPVDVIVLDLEMPGMGGLNALPRVLEVAKDAKVLVVSSLTQRGAEHTLAALAMGATDTLPKPLAGQFDDAYRHQFLSRILALGTVASPSPPRAARSRPGSRRPRKPIGLIAIGGSTGGIHALNTFLAELPASFDLPITVTQHLPRSFMPVFCRQTAETAGRPAMIAHDGMKLRPGTVMIAPGDRHLTLRKENDCMVARLSSTPAPSGCLPSVDPMLSSIALATRGEALGIVLSGMGRDGLIGARELSEAGGTILAQDAHSSAVWGMPRAVTEAGIATEVLTPRALAQRITELVPV